MFKGALVFAPLRPVYSVWPEEKEKWEDFKDFSVGILHGDDKDDVLNEEHDIFLINYESIEWLFGSEQPKKPQREGYDTVDAYNRATELFNIKNNAWKIEHKAVLARLKILFSKVDVLVFDELSKMKHIDTKRAKSIKKYLGRFARRWGLTGSPTSNGLMDLFGQMYVLDLGKALGPFITHYRNKYFAASGFGGYTWKLQDGAAEKIYKAVKPLVLRMEAKDYIKMPRITPVTIYVDLPPAARKIYDDMEDELFAEMEGQEFVATNAAGASIKCQQIANGALYKDKVDPLTGLPVRGKREWKAIHDAKLDAMKELIGELQGNPTLWAYWFGHDLERIIKALGKNTKHMDVSTKESAALIKQWNRNEIENLFCQPAGVGHGLNMQEGQAGHMALFNIPWDYEIYMQWLARVARQGNDCDTILVYHLVARNTVDEAKMQTLHNKGMTQKNFLDAMKNYRKARK